MQLFPAIFLLVLILVEDSAPIDPFLRPICVGWSNFLGRFDHDADFVAYFELLNAPLDMVIVGDVKSAYF